MAYSSHLFPISAEITADGELAVAGIKMTDLAAQYGTPLYVYDAATVRRQVSALRERLLAAYPAEFEITYAAKAYFSLGLSRHLAGMGIGVDVVSMGELAIARQGGFSSDRIHLHGNNKTPAEIVAAIELGVQAIVVDSLEELELVAQYAQERGRTARVWLRISPGVGVNTHAAVQTAHHATKFGLPIVDGQAAEAIRMVQRLPALQLTGLHTHLGSNFFEAEPYREAIFKMVELAESQGAILPEISPGGGWGVPYLPQQPDNGPERWIDVVTNAVCEVFDHYHRPLPRLVVEPGRWLIARAGVALYTVGTTKRSGDGTHFIAIDGGMADNPRPALYQSEYTAILANKADAVASKPVSVAGRYCESGDLLIHEVMLPDVVRGDLLATPAAGAYQLSMASNYNLTPRPAVLWLDSGQVEVLQQREQIEQSGWWLG